MMAWTRSNTNHPLAEEAARWLIELEEPGPEVLQAFGAWLETSPRHVDEFLLVSALWKEFDNLDPGRRLEIRQLIEEAKNNVSRLAPEASADADAAPPVQWQVRGRRLHIAAAAAIVCLATAMLWLFTPAATNDYETSRGEQRAIKLDDGSVIYLNTQSRVEVRFSRTARDVHLLDGEALVAVEHDAARPFRVLSDQTVIQAVGTRFNVYRNPAGTIVSVVEGIVAISPAKTGSMPARSRVEASAPATTVGERLAAGEQARVSQDGEIVEIVKRDVEDLQQVVAWRDRRLVFRGDPLEAVAREFNRYNQVQIRLEGDAIRSKRLTGTFDADDPRSLALFLSRDASLEVRDNGVDEVVIRQR